MRLLATAFFLLGASAQNLNSVLNNLSGPAPTTSVSAPLSGAAPVSTPVAGAPVVPATVDTPAAPAPAGAPVVPPAPAAIPPPAGAPVAPSPSGASAAPPAPAAAPAVPPNPGCGLAGGANPTLATPGAAPVSPQQPIVGPKAREMDNQLTNLRTAIELFQDFQRQYQLADDNPIMQQIYQLFGPILQAANNIR